MGALLQYEIIKTAQSVRKITSLKEIIFNVGTLNIYFTSLDIQYLERAHEGGEHIHLPYCYVNSVWWKAGQKEYRNILNDDKFLNFIKREGVYEVMAFCQSELELVQWLDRSLYQFQLLDQLIREYQSYDGVPLSEMTEVIR